MLYTPSATRIAHTLRSIGISALVSSGLSGDRILGERDIVALQVVVENC
jgi:hypothetical protein